MNEFNDYLEVALSMARSAGNVLLEYFRGDSLEIQTKINDSDVVTAADKASESLIRKTIHEKFPGHGILAEESGEESGESEWRWVVDPLDGTTNFSQGLPVFSVSIALEFRGEAVMGVVYAPYLGELFHAVKGCGAFFNGRSISCGHKTRMSEAVLATGMPYDKKVNPDNNLKEIVRIAPEVRGVRRMGSAAVDLCYVGAGFYDAYWELNLKRWDVAAGMLIAREAGAMTESIREDRNYSVLASSPGLMNDMRTYISCRED